MIRTLPAESDTRSSRSFLGWLRIDAGGPELVQTEDQIIVRGVEWTRRLPRDSVSRFAVESGSVRFYRMSGSFLVAEKKNGSVQPLRDFNERLGDEGVSRLEEVAAALNASWNLR